MLPLEVCYVLYYTIKMSVFTRLHLTCHIFYGIIHTIYVISFKQAKSPSGKGHRVVLVTRFFNICIKKSIKFLYDYDLSEDVSENPILSLNYYVVGTTRTLLGGRYH